MVRSSGISATKPVFSSYLLPSFNFGFGRRWSASSSSSSSSAAASDPSTAVTTPSNSPPAHDAVGKPSPSAARRSRLCRTAPDTLRCATCSADLAFASQTVSKGFTGRYGRALLVAPPAGQPSLPNIWLGRNENRQLVTGWHVVADISCCQCNTKLGWKYVDAREESQKYKVGKFILETERVITCRNWEDQPAAAAAAAEEEEQQQQQHEQAWANDAAVADVGGERGREDRIVFDSEDEDECEDVFAGTWDPAKAAQRRSELVARRRSRNG